MTYRDLDVVRRLLETGRSPDLAFPRAEYERRVAATRTRMAAAGIDPLVLTNVSNIAYLTGYDTGVPSAHVALLVPPDGPLRFHCADLEASAMLDTGTVTEIELYAYYDTPVPATAIARRIRELGHGASAIGLELTWANTLNSSALDVRSYTTLRAELPAATIVDATQLVLDERLIKSDAEIAHMRRAATYTAAAMEAGIRAVADGVREHEIAAATYAAMVAAGSENPALDPLIVGGERLGWAPHLAFRRGRIARGQSLYLELSGTHLRYNAPLARSASVGPASKTIALLSERAIAAVELLHASIAPGRSAHDVAVEVRDSGLLAVDGAGNSGTYGYSVGLAFKPVWTECPFYLAPGNDRELRPGMTFHTPISLYVPGRAAVLFSETVLVTETGCEPLTTGTPLALVCA